MASPDTITLLIVDYHAAIGGKTSVPPLGYDLGLRRWYAVCRVSIGMSNAAVSLVGPDVCE